MYVFLFYVKSKIAHKRNPEFHNVVEKKNLTKFLCILISQIIGKYNPLALMLISGPLKFSKKQLV